jgi:hypothetical protein
MFAAVTKLLANLIQQRSPPFFPSAQIPLPQPRQQLFSDFLTHRHPSFVSVSSFLSQRPFFALPSDLLSVSEFMSQQAACSAKILEVAFPVRIRYLLFIGLVPFVFGFLEVVS